jgi:hypothetical protein
MIQAYPATEAVAMFHHASRNRRASVRNNAINTILDRLTIALVFAPQAAASLTRV